MKIKIQIKNRFTGSVIFELETENNTIAKTVSQAVKEKVSLRSADLRSADLRSADLRSADLRSADLSSADLSYADLSSANLCSANLRSANLRSADLRSADLSYAKNKGESYLPIFCKWSHSVVGNEIQIGCKTKSIEEWDLFFNSTEELSTKRGTDDFKQIQAVYESYKAYLNFLNK